MSSSSPHLSAFIEKQYVKMTQVEHILKRPDTYIGSVVKTQEVGFIHNAQTQAMEHREFCYVPGLYKIFDEILVNAADNRQRDASMDTLKVSIDPTENSISIYNNGRGVPIAMHPVHKCYVPELIFGQLLTSSNYNDEEQRTTGGRNGYGAKLTNIFSDKFQVETVDSKAGLKYVQMWRANMGVTEKPKITPLATKDNKKEASDYTKITFWPDLEKFDHMTSLNETDIVSLFRKRVWDIAGTTNFTQDPDAKPLKVWFNGERLHIKNFKDYVALHLQKEQQQNPLDDGGAEKGDNEASSVHPKVLPPFVYDRPNDRWEICVATSKDGTPRQVSFVNSISTPQGGSHVDYIQDQIAKHVSEYILKKHKVTVKPPQVRNYLFLFVNCLLVNPTFETQTKTKLKMNRTAFGSKCELDDKFLKSIVSKTDLIQEVIAFAAFQSNKEVKKGDGKKTKRILGIPKLEDANEAGGKNSEQTTLILCEGDSAKALVMSGLSVIGRDLYGVFPLKGKLLNVREVERSKAIQNEEIGNLVKILGLQAGKKYESTKDLRYGHVMVMTDQDYDGFHVKGLLINLFSAWWPELLKIDGFLQEFITPIVKVAHHRSKDRRSFYTLPEFETWKKENADSLSSYSMKYYKGLGTSTSHEAKEYFSDLKTHKLTFRWESTRCDEAIQLAFEKGKVSARKDWLANYIPGTYLDQSKGCLTYNDFVHKELILFSVASNLRAIPSIVDGLKPGQRKILYVAFMRNLVKEIKVAQLAGSVAEKSAYHHGEASLMSTIIGLAQDFTSSNNLNLFYPAGQFGTRHNGGKDAASARYIFTHLTAYTRSLFPSEDDPLLNYLNDDGQSVEPLFYVPILPMVLANGSSGIGTGWASSVPNYNPRDLVSALLSLMDGKEPDKLHPWYRGFTGSIRETDHHKYTVYGRIEKLEEGVFQITELPLFEWTVDYKILLESMVESKDILEFKEYHTDTKVRFTVKMNEEQQTKAESVGLYKKFKLTSSIATSNMVLFDQHGQLKKYESPLQILQEFYSLRLEFYRLRKADMVRKWTEECELLLNKVRYIKAVRDGSLTLMQTNEVLLNQLVRDGYKRVCNKDDLVNHRTKFLPTIFKFSSMVNVAQEHELAPPQQPKLSDYYYLVHHTQLSLTLENAERLFKESEERQRELHLLLDTSPKQMWRRDLEKFMAVLADFEATELKKANQEKAIKKKKRGSDDRDEDESSTQATKKKRKQESSTENTLKEPLSVGVYIDPPHPGPVTKEKGEADREIHSKSKQQEIVVELDDDVLMKRLLVRSQQFLL